MIGAALRRLAGGCPDCDARHRRARDRQRQVDDGIACAQRADHRLDPAMQHSIDQIQTAVVRDLATHGIDLADPDDALVAMVTVSIIEQAGSRCSRPAVVAVAHAQAMRGLYEAVRARHDSDGLDTASQLDPEGR